MHFLIFLLAPAACVYYLAGFRDAGIEGKKTGYLAGLAAGVCAIIVNGIFYQLFPQSTEHFFVKLAMVFFSESLVPYILVFLLSVLGLASVFSCDPAVGALCAAQGLREVIRSFLVIRS